MTRCLRHGVCAARFTSLVRVATANLPHEQTPARSNDPIKSKGGARGADGSNRLETGRHGRRPVRFTSWKFLDIGTLDGSPFDTRIAAKMETVDVNDRWNEGSRMRVKES
jgi:hypothetical protein